MKSTCPTLLFLFSLAFAAFGQPEHPDLCYPSPDKKWRITAKWAVDHYDWEIRNNRTGKAHFGEEYPPNDPVASRYITAIWSPDSHYVAVDLPRGSGRFTHECAVYSIEEDKAKSLWVPWFDTSAFLYELLKDKEIRRFTGSYRRNRFSAKEWINNTDLEVSCDVVAELNATKIVPEESFDVVALVTFRFDTKNRPRIIRGKYETYGKQVDQ